MSWDASLDGHDWNYTHNTNRMIYDVLRRAGRPVPEGESWWSLLHGMTRDDGANYLALIIRGLEARPDEYRAMNPENSWGDYDGLLKVLRGMHDVSAAPTPRWWVSG